MSPEAETRVELADGREIPASAIPFDGPLGITPMSDALDAVPGDEGDYEDIDCKAVGCDETRPENLVIVDGSHEGIYCPNHMWEIFGRRTRGFAIKQPVGTEVSEP